MIVSDGCGSFNCEPFGPGSRLVRTNPGPGTRDVIIEVTSFSGLPPGIGLMFDLTAKLSLPPGGVQVSPVGGLQTTEAGGTASFNVVLIAPPLQPVEIPLRSTDPGEGAVKPASLRFDGTNWSQPQVVTVTGVDDTERDGVQSYTVVVEKATSADSRYAGVDGDDVQVTNRDDEPGFALDQTRPAVTSESGGVASIAVSLNRAPTATVRLPVASSDTSEGRVQAAELVFEPANWGVAQFIRITGVDDSEMDGNQMYQLQLGPATSADPAYNGIDPPDLAVLNTDNEYQRVAAQPVSGRLECLFGRSHIGADQGGRLYVAMQCVDPIPGSGGSGPVDASPATPGMVVPIFPSRDAGSADLRPGQLGGPAAFVTTSADGGRTFGVPVNTGWQLREMRIAGTTSENAVLAMLGGPVEAMVLRTTDAGATWQPPSMLGSGFGDLVLATGGQTVVVAFESGNGPAVWVSIDGGRTFNRRFIPELRTTRAAHVDPASGAITLVGFDGVLHVRRSTDNGVTFGQEMTAPANFLASDSVALGPRSLFAMDKDTTLMVAPLDDLSARRDVIGLVADDDLPADPGGGQRRQRGGAGRQLHERAAAPAGLGADQLRGPQAIHPQRRHARRRRPQRPRRGGGRPPGQAGHGRRRSLALAPERLGHRRHRRHVLPVVKQRAAGGLHALGQREQAAAREQHLAARAGQLAQHLFPIAVPDQQAGGRGRPDDGRHRVVRPGAALEAGGAARRPAPPDPARSAGERAAGACGARHPARDRRSRGWPRSAPDPCR